MGMLPYFLWPFAFEAFYKSVTSLFSLDKSIACAEQAQTYVVNLQKLARLCINNIDLQIKPS